jgi:hypothetical protein
MGVCGYWASHPRNFSGPRLHLVATLSGAPIGFALTGAKADERQTLRGILTADPAPPVIGSSWRPGHRFRPGR